MYQAFDSGVDDFSVSPRGVILCGRQRTRKVSSGKKILLYCQVFTPLLPLGSGVKFLKAVPPVGSSALTDARIVGWVMTRLSFSLLSSSNRYLTMKRYLICRSSLLALIKTFGPVTANIPPSRLSGLTSAPLYQ